jgi:DNA polymerase III subunit delta'
VPIVILYGHGALQARLREAVERHTLPASLLLHGPRGVGKQRLALWLGQLLLCTGEPPAARPCGACQSCRYAGALAHPDLHWFFPRPRLKDTDATPAKILDDLAEAASERAEQSGLYAPPSGDHGIYVATVRAMLQQAALTPALGRRKVFVLGEADRMVQGTDTDTAANAFLKLLEEPPGDTTLVLTSSEPGALLPTIRSRLVAVRVPRLPDEEVRRFLADPAVAAALRSGGPALPADELISRAAGAPGTLLADGKGAAVREGAQRLLEAGTLAQRAGRYRAAFGQGVAGARGTYSDVLEELTVMLHERARDAARRDDAAAAMAASRAVESVERAKELAAGNVNPQLVTAALVRELADLFVSTSPLVEAR